MRILRAPAGLRPGVLPLVATWALLTPSFAEAQAVRFEGGAEGRLIARDGTALIIEADGPSLTGPREFFYRPNPPFDVRHRWVLVQDSTFGVVFSQGSGVRTDISSFYGDLYLRALAGVRAIEVRVLTFNVWGDPTGNLAVTVLVDRAAGESWEVHPRWPLEDEPAHEHRTSIVWINRVMFDDQSILEADLSPIGRAYEHVTGSDFEGLADGPPLRAIGL